ncbi:zinc metalloprotease HtpX [Desulfosarcina sp. OttesenSCG-928-A07]|nr:zinc metalloprotease HtpX [Desulfosarcina sp. OttesenSCG-928-G17]MDL2328257.1 zinc metalloprotease HtpX [Desulfosarcina sp. OttesenSCG-928-A07]
MGNRLKTTLLLATMTILVMVVGNLIGGRQGMFLALIMAAAMNFVSYWYSDKLVLKMYNAHEVTPVQAPDLYDMVKTLTLQANLPMPKVYVIPTDTPNAFATGRNPKHAAVAVTQGLLNLMDRQEIMGVLAHELAHVKNRDILISTLAATMAGAIMMLASMARWTAFLGGSRNSNNNGGLGAVGMILMSVLAPFAAMIVQMAVSRSREYLADATGARIAGSPEGLAQALEKLDAYSRRIPMQASPATAHMFIVNPLSGGGLQNLFSTHPPMDQRIRRLRGTPAPDRSGPSGPPSSGSEKDSAFWDLMQGR